MFGQGVYSGVPRSPRVFILCHRFKASPLSIIPSYPGQPYRQGLRAKRAAVVGSWRQLIHQWGLLPTMPDKS